MTTLNLINRWILDHLNQLCVSSIFSEIKWKVKYYRIRIRSDEGFATQITWTSSCVKPMHVQQASTNSKETQKPGH